MAEPELFWCLASVKCHPDCHCHHHHHQSFTITRQGHGNRWQRKEWWEGFGAGSKREGFFGRTRPSSGSQDCWLGLHFLIQRSEHRLAGAALLLVLPRGFVSEIIQSEQD